MQGFRDFPCPRRYLREDYTPTIGNYREILLAHINSEDQDETLTTPVQQNGTQSGRTTQAASHTPMRKDTQRFQVNLPEKNRNTSEVQEHKKEKRKICHQALMQRLNLLELSLEKEKRESNTWKDSMPETLNGLTQTQETTLSSLNKVTSMVIIQDDRLQRIYTTHQTIQNLLPWLCQRLGRPQMQELETQRTQDAQAFSGNKEKSLSDPSRRKSKEGLP